YKRASLTKMGTGYGGTIPCDDVKAGLMRYYIQGFDAAGDPMALSGDPKRPYVVHLRQTIGGLGPSLPGQPPPRSCSAGESGATSDEPSTTESTPPETKDASEYARFWVGVAGSFDLQTLPPVEDSCKLSQRGFQQSGYYCVT